MNYQVIPYTTRPEWLNLRRNGLGASDIAAIIGISTWTTARQLWVQKTTPDAPEPITNEDMEWGTRVETLILDEAESRLGCELVRSKLVQNRKHGWMMATLDGFHPGDRTGIVVEAKKVDAWMWDEPPPYYLTQVQWQLAVTGYQTAWIAALHRGRRLELYRVEADPELQAQLISAGERFWRSVLDVVPPPVEPSDADYFNELWPTHTEAAVEIDQDLANELRNAKAAANEAKKAYELAVAKVKDALEDADTATVGDEIVATWRTQNNHRLDVKSLRAEEPDIADTYTRKGTSRVFRIKENNR